MLEDNKKHIRQGIIYTIIILVSWLILYPSLVFEYSFKTLPITYTIIFILNIIIVYALFRLQYKFYRQIKKQVFDRKTQADEVSENASGEELEVSEENIEFSKQLLKGITKKTSKKVFAEKLLSNLVKNVQAEVGVYYTYNKKAKLYQVASTYAFFSDEKPPDFKIGEGINGQVVKNKKTMLIKDASESHITVVSGLGKGKPKYLLLLPIILNNQVFALIELASFSKIPETLETELTKFFKLNSDIFLNIDDK